MCNNIYAVTAASAPKTATVASTSSQVNSLQISAATIQGGKNNTTIYTKNVEIRQGTLVITANKAILNNKQKTVLITGTPAKFVDVVSPTNIVNASAKTMRFDSKGNKLILAGDAAIMKNGKVQKGKRIVYNTATHQ